MQEFSIPYFFKVATSTDDGGVGQQTPTQNQGQNPVPGQIVQQAISKPPSQIVDDDGDELMV